MTPRCTQAERTRPGSATGEPTAPSSPRAAVPPSRRPPASMPPLLAGCRWRWCTHRSRHKAAAQTAKASRIPSRPQSTRQRRQSGISLPPSLASLGPTGWSAMPLALNAGCRTLQSAQNNTQRARQLKHQAVARQAAGAACKAAGICASTCCCVCCARRWAPLGAQILHQSCCGVRTGGRRLQSKRPHAIQRHTAMHACTQAGKSESGPPTLVN